jgi:hypothetical protein
MTVEEIRTRFERATAEAPTYIIANTLTQSITEGPFSDAFGWLLTAIEEVRVGKPPSSGPVAEIPDPRSAAALESKLEEWLVRAENESSSEQFLHQFETFSLPAWDHYTHIRIAYLLLTIHGRQKGLLARH